MTESGQQKTGQQILAAQKCAPDSTGAAPMAELRAIIFDVDGTLADTERNGHLVAYNRTFADFDLPWRWTEEQYRELLEITGGGERLRHFIGKQQTDLVLDTDQLEKLVLKLHTAKNQHYRELLHCDAVPLRPGVKRLIEESRAAGIRLAIATASQLTNVYTLIEHNLGTDAINWFEIIVGGDTIAAKKPAPDVYQRVIAELHLPCDEVLAVEDSAQGLQSALSTGIRTLVTTNHFTEQQDFEGAVAVVNHLGEPDLPCQDRTGSINGRVVDLEMLRSFGFDEAPSKH